MNDYYTIFEKKKIAFKGTREDLEEYAANTGIAYAVDKNLDLLINGFKECCQSSPEDRHYLHHAISKTISLVLLWNQNNKYNLYMMLYDKQNDRRVLGIHIEDVPNLYNQKKVERMMQILPEMCKFSEHILSLQNTKDIWMLNDLQNFADSIDKWIQEYGDD